MKKVLMTLVSLVIVLFAESERVLVTPNVKDPYSSEALWNQFAKDLNSTRDNLEKKIEKKRLLDLKKRESFKNGERLFCENHQVVLSKKGWVLEGALLIKDDHYYFLDDCFLQDK